MASAVVDVWVGELAKLGEKVKMKKSLLLKLKTSTGKAQQEEHTNFKLVEADNDTTTLSESTLFLLMDSFAPS